MSIICHVDYTTALKYKGLNLKTKWNNKNHPVYLKLLCDDTNILDGISLARSSRNIMMIDYQGIETGEIYPTITSDIVGNVYVGKVIEFGNNIQVEDIERIVSDFPSGIVPVIKLPEDFKNMRLLANLTSQYPKLRFCGGELFAISDVKVGAIGVDTLELRGAKYTEESYYLRGTDDVLPVVDIESLEIDTTGKAEKKSKSTSSSKKKSSSGKKKLNFGAMMLAMDNKF